MGLQASLTLERPGFRIKKRKVMKRTIPRDHRISREDSINFMKHNFAVKIKEEQ
jgi:large subunit ribosomal protein L5